MDVNEAADHIFGLVLMNDWSGMHEISLIFKFIQVIYLEHHQFDF